eukprot:TRINITY_DN25291_c0_g1_i1.p1 TRINITY_DN25291_c0_g1~~TRINITY_DN25291_c0_g1_i1.p1  ORF type:complete len:289 (+),score=42.59 TRINITY_DN25291_c0_g1_i1:82-948(+)
MPAPTIVANHELVKKMNHAVLSGELKLCWVVHKVCKGLVERRQKRILAITTRAVYLADFKGLLRRVFQLDVVSGMTWQRLEKPDKSHQTVANFEIVITTKPSSGEPALVLAIRDDRRNVPQPSVPETIENVFRTVLGDSPFNVNADTSSRNLIDSANIKKTQSYVSPLEKMASWKNQPRPQQRQPPPFQPAAGGQQGNPVGGQAASPAAAQTMPAVEKAPSLSQSHSQSPEALGESLSKSSPERTWTQKDPTKSLPAEPTAVTYTDPNIPRSRNNKIIITCVPVPVDA